MSKQKKRNGENPKMHNCALCPYSTKHLGHYKQHLKTHSKEKPFKCPECPFKTKQKHCLKQHLSDIHSFDSSSSRPFPCPEPGCNYAAKQKSSLTLHSKIHSDETLAFFCSHANCNYSTKYKNCLLVHVRRHTGENPFVCQFESCAFATNDLLRHSRIHTKEKPFKCPEANCEYAAAQNSSLKRHQLTHHPKEGEERPLFSCPLCEYSGKTKANLSAHARSHTLEKWFKCEEPNCNYEANSKQAIKSHKLVHSGEKPFACSLESCEYRCKFKSSLSTHLKTHNEERQYKCKLCPHRGKTRSDVTTHLKNVHSDLRPFKCTEPKCDYAAKRMDTLKLHVLAHKGEKKYSCSFLDCEYRAINKACIKSHEYKIHSDEKKENCLICLYKCKTKTALTIHMRNHTKEEPYKCKEPNCEYRAKQGGNLKTHITRCHSEAT